MKASVPRTVEEYMKNAPPEARGALRRLRAAIKAAAPEATELITYQMPGFKAHGRALVSYAAFRGHYSLFPMGLSAVNAHIDRVRPYLSGKSTIRFSYEKPLPVTIVRLIVKARLVENAERAATRRRDGRRGKRELRREEEEGSDADET